ncbi:MAG: DUF1385 domain-containing protein [Candidatus Dormibacteraeota bacterium]|nr:DUF1385 domain-containing protein [Candidatus Dormibacteraeota bacterium]MBV9525298.1 DUF1385 domain-containing protein [Candidatus Dormibacteraeota bacterium]
MRLLRLARDITLTAAVNAVNAPPATFFYGGQAVIEGVLMRGRNHYAVAARKPDGQITVVSDELRSRVYTSKVWKQPFLRGVAGLFEMVHLGMRALQWSAGVQLGDEVAISAGAMRIAMGVSVVFGLALFIGAPLGISALIHRAPARSVTSVVIEGVVRGVILVGYLLLIGLVPSVRRLFHYHGAEHKSINCLESGAPLDVEHVRPASRLHPRCGTGFIVVVAVVSIVVFTPLGLLPTAVRILCQIALVPVVAAISYETIRALARVRHTAVGRIALAPVLSAQLLSTREPNDSQIEVAIVALQAARADESAVGELVAVP